MHTCKLQFVFRNIHTNALVITIIFSSKYSTLTIIVSSSLSLINNQWTRDCESLAQRMSALEERIEQLNARMRELEMKLEHTQPESLILATPSYPKPVENCCTPSVFVHGSLVYEFPSASACPVHQDVSPHTVVKLQ